MFHLSYLSSSTISSLILAWTQPLAQPPTFSGWGQVYIMTGYPFFDSVVGLCIQECHYWVDTSVSFNDNNDDDGETIYNAMY